MSIRRNVNSVVTETDVGKYVNIDDGFRDTICSKPWKITKVSKSRIYLEREIPGIYKNVELETRFINQQNVVFVSDTEEEGNKMYKLSQDRKIDLMQTRNDVIMHYEGVITDIINSK
jgi:hypothetical protein